ncbi:TPA: hypothetical protein N0F65_008574 [Lagenidium giganteum]|uniref:Uncharacterized protein n=1 Tax=Lagenidium giganteum TaxID=4803 RepID=A0AAV2Z2W3_9STRA|nr:TPA: hypothetical protein N0F65_008574 [Lagenidium giganteum]
MQLFERRYTCSHVPLQRPWAAFRLRINMIGAPSFRVSLCGGIPGKLRLLRISC